MQTVGAKNVENRLFLPTMIKVNAGHGMRITKHQ